MVITTLAKVTNRGRRLLSTWVALTLALVTWMSCRPVQEQQDQGGQERAVSLEDNIRYSIRTGQRWSRTYELEERRFLFLIVEQHGADVAVDLIGDSEKFTVDSPNGSHGHEEVVAILEPGRHQIEISVGKDTIGEFLIRTVAFRPVSPGDTDHVGADRAYHRGRRLYKEADYERAIEVFRESIQVWERQGRPWREAMTLDAMALAFLESGQSTAARAVLTDAIEIARQARESHERRILGDLLNRLGVLERSSFRRAGRAVDSFDEAVEIAEDLGLDEALATFLINRAQAKRTLGRLQAALDDLTVAFEHTTDPESLAQIWTERARVYLALHAPDEAVRAVSSLREQVDESSISAGHRAEAAILEARAYAQTADLESARIRVEAGLEQARIAREPQLVANLLQRAGAIERGRGDLIAAKARFDEAMEISRSLGDELRTATLYVELGYLRLMKGDPETALERIESAQETFRRLGALRSLATAQARSAEALRALGRLEEAAERAEAALETVERLRGDTRREDVRQSFFAFRQEYFDIGLEIALQRWSVEPTEAKAWSALEVHERRLAVEAREKIDQNSTLQLTTRSGSQDADEQRVMRELAALLRQPGLDPSERSERSDRLYARLAELRGAERSAYREELPPDRFDPRELLDRLDRGTTVLVYAMGSEASVVWSLSGNRIRLHRLPWGRQEVSDRVSDWRRLLLSGRPDERSEGLKVGRSLARQLLPSTLDLGTVQRLVVVPDGALHALPFGALVIGRSEGERTPEPKFLIEAVELASLPSLSHLQGLRTLAAQRSGQMRPAAIFADAVYGPGDPRMDLHSTPADPFRASSNRVRSISQSSDRSGPNPSHSTPFTAMTTPRGSTAARPPVSRVEHRVLRSFGSQSVSRIPATEREAEVILSLISVPGSWAAKGFEASKETVLQSDLTPFGILHFAVHGLVDTERPDLSVLILSRFNSEGRERDSFLYGFEVGALSVTADLVVLSACETGRGRVIRGEGVLGLSRRFFDAGAARVLSSLWQVSDEHTALLMKSFYENLLAEGRSPAAALRQAQIDLLSEPSTSQPFYWAGFLLQGDWQRPQGW